MARNRGGAVLWMAVGITLLALLPLLAVLQYRWIGQVSQAERERMQGSLRTATTLFAQEFNWELVRTCVAFQMDFATLRERDWQRYAERWEYWLRTASYPGLVSNLYFAEVVKGDQVRFLRLNPASVGFQPAGWPAGYQPLERRIAALARGDPSEAGPGMRPFRWTIAEEIPAVVLPIFEPPQRGPLRRPEFGPPQPPAEIGPPQRPPLIGCSIVELNLAFLQSTLLPELARKHFATQGVFSYQVAIVSRSDPSKFVYRSEPKLAENLLASPDSTVNILRLNPDDFFRMSLELAGAGGAPPGVAPATGVGRPPAEGLPGPGPGLGFLAKRPPRETGHWQVAVKHRSGSLENAVAEVRRRNLAVSFGVLMLLGLGVAMMVVSTRRAQRLAKLQMEFVTGVSHELRTPLAVICSAADNLADGVVAPGEPQRQYGALIRNEGRRLTGMIDQILGFATAGRKKYDLRPLDVAGLIDSALASSGPAIQEAGVEVTREIPPHLPPVVADAASVANCLQNLLSNALKYGLKYDKETGWVGIRAVTAAGGGEVQISVEDRGPGIDPQELPHIFEPFYRGARAVAAQIHGTGLGLSLVQRIMEAQGGRVSVRSRPGEGSAFTLHLPAANGLSAGA